MEAPSVDECRGLFVDDRGSVQWLTRGDRPFVGSGWPVRLAEMAGLDVVCLGILVADVIARPVDAFPQRGSLGLVDELTLHGGGGVLNSASWLARWGMKVAAAGKVGADPFGDYLLGLLDERGVEREGVHRDPEVPTSATVVLVDSAGDRTFLHLPGANGALRAEELDTRVLFGGRALLYTGALVMPALDGEPAASILAEARTRGLLTALDTVFDSTGRWSRVLPSLPHVDLFMPGLAEARGVSGLDDPPAAAAWLREQGVGEVAIKLGEQGCYASGAGFEGYLEPIQVRAVDGTGAGDAFVAGALYGKLAGWSFERSVRLGNAAGAQATTAVGAAEGVASLEETLALAGEA
jgi:sugar/nucleoside kinase (ribokinase family)